jgi:hypothetical protein
LPVQRTLTDDDLDAIADRVVALIAKRLNPTAVVPPQPAPVAAPGVTMLAYTKMVLAEELRMSPTSIWRLEQRGAAPIRSWLADEALFPPRG